MTGLLDHRPDVLVEPAPRSVDELAQRLDGVDSLSLALPTMTRDQFVTARAVALLGTATVPALAVRLRAAEPDVRSVLDELCARGLAWGDGDRVGLPDRLAEHFASDVARFRPLVVIARQTRVDELRTAVTGLGADPDGLRKPELIERLAALVADPQTVATAVAELTAPARRHLDSLLDPDWSHFFVRFGRRADDPAAPLVRAGLLVESQYGQAELPREVAVELRFGQEDRLTGRPALASSGDPADDGRAGADGALLALTTLLDEARERPLARLKKGGVGARERARLAKRLALTEPSLWIDVAHAGGLLASSTQGYPATAGYDRWREEEPAARWARVALAWFRVDMAPTATRSRTARWRPRCRWSPRPGCCAGRWCARPRAGARCVPRSSTSTGSARYTPTTAPGGRARSTGSARGGAARDRDGGSAVRARGAPRRGRRAPDPEPELARRCAELLPRTRGMLVLQSDLTAVVSGQPDVAAARVLAAAAESESRGAAATWRFTPASVRGALDAGWTADALRAELAETSGRDLPQPLDYLVTDVARRHATVRVRDTRTCLTGSESEVAEILHTRSLGALALRRLAPTVLTSPFERDHVLARLRAGGFAPMPEDAEGVVLVPERATAPVSGGEDRRPRKRVAAADLAARLRAAGSGPAGPPSATHGRLEKLAPSLNPAEVALLADALDHRRDIRIVYRNKAGNRTVRDVRPQELYGRWLSSWCHLRSGEREFSLSGIESVSPVG